MSSIHTLSPALQTVWQDVRYALRMIIRVPGYSVPIIATLIIAVGLNTVVFSVANTLLLRPWALPDPSQLILVFHRRTADRPSGVSPSEYRWFGEQLQSADLVAWREGDGVRLDTGQGEAAVPTHFVSGEFFGTLRIPLTLGRGIARAEDTLGGGAPVAVIAHSLWTSRFGRDPGVVGRVVRVNGVSFTIIGVAAPGNFQTAGRGMAQLWIPLGTIDRLFSDDPYLATFLRTADACCVEVAGRLRPGATAAEAERELTTLDRRFRSNHSVGDPPNLGVMVTDTLGVNYPRGGAAQSRRMLVTLFGSVVLVLLLACANVGNVQLARALSRRREMTIRLALGASRTRVIRQLLTEALVLSTLATVCSLPIAALMPQVILQQSMPREFGSIAATLDLRLLAFALGATILTCLLTSLAPAVRSSRQLTAVRSGSGLQSGRLRGVLLAFQVGVSALLLVAAGTMASGLARASSFTPGFDVHGVDVLTVQRQGASATELRRLTSEVVDRLAQANVGPVGLATMAPLSAARRGTSVRRDDEPAGVAHDVRVQAVSPGYFAVLQLPVVAGRVFDASQPGEVVINQTFADLLWPTRSPVGQRFGDRVVVGIVADAQLDALGEIAPTFYQLLDDTPSIILVRREPRVATIVKTVVSGVDSQAVGSLRALSANLETALQGARLGALIAGGLGLLAIGLSTIGISGVFSYVVNERTAELAIRRAVGAGPADIVRLVFRRAGGPLLVGLSGGLACAAIAAPAWTAYSFGVAPRDPVVFTGVTAVVLVAGLAATLWPTVRALRVSPVVALKSEH